MTKEYINKDNPVYISYAWGEDFEVDVNKLCKLMDDNSIFFKRDKAKGENCLSPYRYNIIDAEEEIGLGKAIIVVISDKYIKSLHCMYEWHCICKTGDIPKRVFPIVLPNTKLKKDFRYDSFRKFLNKQLQEISDIQVNSSSIEAIKQKCLDNDGYLTDLEILRNYLIDYNIPDLKTLREDNYSTIINQLKVFLGYQPKPPTLRTKKNKKTIKLTPQPKLRKIEYNTHTPHNTPTTAEDLNQGNNTTQSKITENISIRTTAPHFQIPNSEGLFMRKDEENNLLKYVAENRIVNLVGIGGSGKSSLAHLFVNEYKNKEFNEIAYVTINKNIKDDFIDKINETIKLKFEVEEDAFSQIITYLQDNYKSDKPNLLVLDINETADISKNAEIINEIIKNRDFLKDWKFLILSRESVDTHKIIQTYNLDKMDNFDFLKTMFLTKAGESYNDFDDFDELFKMIHYNPLLTEQLGLYLNDYPKRATLDDIKTILGESLQEEEMQGMSAQQHEETIISFLKNLIVFDKLDKNEQKLLRHFVLWQADYIKYDVIADLLNDILKSDALIKTLKSLSRRSILTTDNPNKKGTEDTLSYKLHGLLATSIREQIGLNNSAKCFIGQLIFLLKILIIILIRYPKYLKNIKRIIKSNYYDFLPYIECIGNGMDMYSIPRECQIIKNQNSNQIELANAHSNLAIVQTRNKKQTSAIENYKAAIKIREQIEDESQDNTDNQDNLSILHYNLAISSNDSNSIDDNPEYQKILANAYYNLAGESSSQKRIQNLTSAIGIYKKMAINNPTFLNNLITIANALTYCNNEEENKAKELLNEIKEYILISATL